MTIDPKVVKLALRIAGTMIVSLKTVLPGIWGNLAFVVGTNMVSLSINAYGSVSKWDFGAILDAANAVIPNNVELRLRKSIPPITQPSAADAEGK